MIVGCVPSIQTFMQKIFYHSFAISRYFEGKFNRVSKISIIEPNQFEKHTWTNVSTFIFFNKIPVYKQLALEWQISQHLSGLNSFSLSNSKNYRLKKSGVFLW